MVGEQPNIGDLVSQEEPSVLDLNCYEDIPAEEEESEYPYAIVLPCGLCDQLLRLTCVSDLSTCTRLEELLLGSLRIVCPLCAIRHQRH